MSRGNNTHEQYVTRCPVSHLVHSPGRMASVITRKISTRDPGITILRSQLTGLARLSNNYAHLSTPKYTLPQRLVVSYFSYRSPGVNLTWREEHSVFLLTTPSQTDLP